MVGLDGMRLYEIALCKGRKSSSVATSNFNLSNSGVQGWACSHDQLRPVKEQEDWPERRSGGRKWSAVFHFAVCSAARGSEYVGLD